MNNHFILLHKIENNSLVGINVNDIVCVSRDNQIKKSFIYLTGREKNMISVNETPNDILKRIGDSRKFILVHSQSRNNEILLPNDLVVLITEQDKSSSITINNEMFAVFTVNESLTSIVNKLNQ